MQLNLESVVMKVGAETWLHPLDLAPRPGALTVLLGATQAGKTSLMRLMAGLDAPTAGRVLVDGKDVTGVPVRRRNVSMVYQQFINYPSFTVAQNIGSPLRLRGTLNRKEIARQVRAIAERLRIQDFLDRLPAQLSGGQQQRVALARALAKRAPLMLLDEPLVNLDYKLREELRNELTQLFAGGEATVVYATTEPGEALLLGGYTAVLDAGELLQYGPTAEVFHAPRSLRVARAFSDPPMNLLEAEALGSAGSGGAGAGGAGPGASAGAGGAGGVQLRGGTIWNVPLPASASRALTVGVRASSLRVRERTGDIALPGVVELAEISGSDTFLHVDTPVGGLVAQLTGVHEFALGARMTLWLDPGQVYVFDAAGDLLALPRALRARGH
jgi:glycerol transport system ATP-binding protein